MSRVTWHRASEVGLRVALGASEVGVRLAGILRLPRREHSTCSTTYDLNPYHHRCEI